MAEITLKIETKKGVGIEKVTEALSKLGFVVSVTPLTAKQADQITAAVMHNLVEEDKEDKAIVRAIRAAERSPLITKEKLLSIFD